MKKHVILFILFFSFVSCFKDKSKDDSDNQVSLNVKDRLVTPILNNETKKAETTKLKLYILENLPKPLKVVVPSIKGGNYTFKTAEGEAKKINLEPPLKTFLPVLKNEKGETIRDKYGNPFILGYGGISNFTNYTTDNGLALDAITASCIDHLGNLWFGTGGGGVSRFDGKSFVNFSTTQGLANNIVWSIMEDKSGSLWFGTYGGGVSHYDGKSFTTYTTAQGLGNNTVFAITQDHKGNIWFGTQGGGVSRYDAGKSNNPCNTNTCKHNLHVLNDVEEHNKEISKSFFNFTTAQGLCSNVVLSIAEENSDGNKDQNLWFGTGGGGVSCYTGNNNDNPCNSNSCKHNLNNKKDLKEHNAEIAKSFLNYTTAEGLANDNVFSIAADKDGYIWFGTGGGGASRLDNRKAKALHNLKGDKKNFQNRQSDKEKKTELSKAFVTFTTEQGLANNNVYSIVEDNSGNLWFGTLGGGVSIFIKKCEMESSYRESGNFQNGVVPEGQLNTFVQSFISFTTTQGLVNNNVWTITKDKSGNIWFGTQGGGVSRYDGNSFVSFTTEQGLANNNVYSIAEDKKRNFWFGTDGGGISYYDGKSFTKFSTSQGLANNNVYSIAEDKSGNVWFGTQGGGVCRYDGKSFVSLTTEQGMANNSIRSITEDIYGNLCFGTYGGGLSFYDGNRVDAIEKGILASQSDKRELKRINGKYVRTIINITKAQGLSNNSVLCVTEDISEEYGKGNLWIGTDGGGVSVFRRKSDNLCLTNSCNHNFNLQPDIVNHNKEISKSFLTISTFHGLANNSVWCIRQDKSGNLWFGTAGGGISLLTKDNVKRVIEKFSENKKADTANKIHFINFTTSDGLPDNNVTQIVEGDNGKIYAGTKSGIFELIGKDSVWRIGKVFNSTTGYPVKDVNAGQNAMFRDSKGIIWIATGSDKTALIRFDSNAKQKSIETPKVLLQQVRIDEAPVSWYDLKPGFSDSTTLAQQEIFINGKPLLISQRDSIRKKYKGIQFDNISAFYSVPENLVLPYKHNSISFDFVALETGVNFSVRYQYILEGYSKEWSPVTEKTSATFGNMYEGKYAFKIRASSPEGIWSEPLVYYFQVLPPWWRTWWAYGSYLLFFLWGLRIFSKIREWSLLEKQKVLEKTVEIRTAEVVAEKKKSDDLLLNILPEEVAEELKLKGSAAAKLFDQVTVMFTDFKGFTQISEKLSPADLVAEIDICFKAFDEIITRHNIEKIKTIGDSYMCAGGLPVINASNAVDVVKAAIEIQEFMKDHLHERVRENKEPFEIRIGIHTGPVVAGIVGLRKFAYDIWGDTVNIASRMESSGEAGKINISGATYEMVKDAFKCSYRGKIQAKNKGEIDMYFVECLS